MKLNPDCIRQVLLFLEKNIKITTDTMGKKKTTSVTLIMLYDAKKLEKFSHDDIWYTVLKLFEGEYISGTKFPNNPEQLTRCSIKNITLIGHNLLDNIRDNKIWTKTKKGISELGGVSLNVISTVAGKMAAEYTKGTLGM